MQRKAGWLSGCYNPALASVLVRSALGLAVHRWYQQLWTATASAFGLFERKLFAATEQLNQ